MRPPWKHSVDTSPDELRGENYTIFTGVTLAYTGFSASFPFLVVYLLQVRGVPLSQVGIIYLVSGVVGILGQIWGGKITDRLGTRTVTVSGFAFSAVLYAMISILVVRSVSILAFIALYAVLNLFSNLSQLSLSSYISDRPRDRMAGGMSLLYVGLNLGFTIGPVTGGFLIDYSGYWSIFLFGSLTSALAAIITALRIKSNPRYALRRNDAGLSVKKLPGLRKGLYPYFILVAVSWFAIGYQAVPLSAYESQFLSLSSFLIGVVLTTNGLLITVLQVPISRLVGVERRMRLHPIALGSAIMAAGFIVIAFARSLIGLELAILLTTTGEMMIAVPTQVIASMFSGRENRGEYQGYYFAFSRGGLSASAYVGTLVFGIFIAEPYAGWYIIAGVSAAAALGYFAISNSVARFSNRNED